MPETVTLVVPHGAQAGPISHGSKSYRPYMANPSDPATVWLVDVPGEIVPDLEKYGGFTIMPQDTAQNALPAGMVRVKHPQGFPCSFRGVSYEPGPDGTCVVPSDAAGELVQSHGYALVEGETKQGSVTVAPKHYDTAVPDDKDHTDEAKKARAENAAAEAKRRDFDEAGRKVPRS